MYQLILVLSRFFLVLMMISNASAQNILANYDSIPISKVSFFKETYQINNPLLTEINIPNRFPKSVEKLPKNIFGGAVTILTGIGTSSSSQTPWVCLNEIKTANMDYQWQTPFYFQGTYNKTRERVRNDDGSYSLNTEKTVSINWDNGIYGYIVEKNDTIGEFVFNRFNEIDDQNVMEWLDKIAAHPEVNKDRSNNIMSSLYYMNYLVEGSFKGTKFILIANGKKMKSILLIENEPLAIFFNNTDEALISKKKRTSSYVLIDQVQTKYSQIDLLRLFFLNSIISKTVHQSYYIL